MEASLWSRCRARAGGRAAGAAVQHLGTAAAGGRERGGGLRLLAPNRFVVDWVRSNLLARIEDLLRRPTAARRRVTLEVGSPARRRRPAAAAPAAPARTAPAQRRRVLGARLNPNFTFDSFVEGKSNHFAKAAALQVAENPGTAYNPLFIYGGVGLGKTHLMHAIGHLIRERNPDARVAYVHSERFVSDMVRALQHNTHQRIQEHLSLAARAADRRHPVLRRQGPLAGRVLPHLQRAARGPAPGHPHLRSLSEGSRRTGRAAEIALRLGSDGRDRAAGTGNLRRDPDRQGAGCRRRTAGGSGLFHRQAHPLQRARAGRRAAPRDRQCALHRAGRSRWNSRRKRCKDLLTLQARLVTVENIQKTVADYYKVRIADLLSKRRSRSVARPRQVAMALAKELTTHSLPEIGDAFGGRDHTTVLHACKRIKRAARERASACRRTIQTC